MIHVFSKIAVWSIPHRRVLWFISLNELPMPKKTLRLTRALPRCLPTPTEEAGGGGAGVLSPGGEVPWAAV